MRNTVVLGGDQSIVELIDGDLDLTIHSDVNQGLLSIIDGDANLLETIDGDLSLNQSMPGELGIITEIHGGAYPEYTGSTTITPTTETQVLETNQKSVLSNITINPIPSNYGLITWNGSSLTVS